MSSTSTTSVASGPKEFVLWAPDYTDKDALNRRLAARAKHIEGAQALVKRGMIKMGGPMASITDEDSSDSGGVMNGTLWIFLAKNATEVREIIERDPYWVDNVWDKEKVEIRQLIAVKHT